MTAYVLDQQLPDNTHGTPHAVAYVGCFIPGNSAKARSLGYATEVGITLGTMAGGGDKASRLPAQRRLQHTDLRRREAQAQGPSQRRASARHLPKKL